MGWLRERRPHIPVVYVADNRGFPYGERDIPVLREAVLRASTALFGLGTPRLLVLACNTASVAVLEDLRKAAPCPVVGTVPAVKPAAALPAGGTIGLLATEGTVRSSYLDDLARRFAPGRRIEKVAADAVVRYVEERWLDDDGRSFGPIIDHAARRIQRSGATAAVLGCTHFLHVADRIAEALGPDIALVDSREGVGRRILDLLGSFAEPEKGSSNRKAAGSFLVTDPQRRIDLYRRFAERYDLSWGGGLV